MRSTVDIDSTVRNLHLSEEEITGIVTEICKLDLGDGITFRIKDVSSIMDEMEYPGIRISMDSFMGKMATPIKIDISTGDIITPRAIEYSYKLMLEEREIKLWSYNLETILAEKLQTVLVRGTLNTRMRDFYDIHTLLTAYSNQTNESVLSKAFAATCDNRATPLEKDSCLEIIEDISSDEALRTLWNGYRRKYSYAEAITYDEVIESMKKLQDLI